MKKDARQLWEDYKKQFSEDEEWPYSLAHYVEALGCGRPNFPSARLLTQHELLEAIDKHNLCQQFAEELDDPWMVTQVFDPNEDWD